MAISYFTRAAFRTFAGDPGGATPTYTDGQIDQAQAVVIEHLERWARTSWANVTGTNGDGTAAAYNQVTEVFDGGLKRYLVNFIPIQSVQSVEVGDVAQTVDENYWLYAAAGEIRFGSELTEGFQKVEIQYRYGHGTTPEAIKLAAMEATKSLLDGTPGEDGIPDNVTQYTVEGTTFLLQGEEKNDVPWPWDRAASKDVIGYWAPSRPTMTGSRV